MGLTKEGLERLWLHITAKFDELVGKKPVAEQIEEAVAGIEIQQSDWKQSDETAADYVKNRTHYEYIGEHTFIENEPIVITQTGQAISIVCLQENAEYAIEAGKPYTVIINGTEYDVIAQDSEPDGFITLGDQSDAQPFWIQYSPTHNDYRMTMNQVGDYIVSVKHDGVLAKTIDTKFIPASIARVNNIPSNLSDLVNDAGYITQTQMHAYATKQYADSQLMDHNTAPDAHEDIRAAIPTIPTNVSAFTNDAGYLTEHQDLTAYATKDFSLNSVSIHNTNTASHNDIRLLLEGLNTRLNALADSDDTTLDQMSEIVAYIKANKDLIDGVTTNKVNVSDIIDNLTTNVTNKPLSASQGVALKQTTDILVTGLSNANNTIGALISDVEKCATKEYVNAQIQAATANLLTREQMEVYVEETILGGEW